MSRDWDKLRRQDKARAPLSRSQLTTAAMARRKENRKRWRRKNRGTIVARPVGRRSAVKRVYKPVLERELSIWSAAGTSRAIFRRTGGTWHCVSVNNPAFEWFLRIKNLDKIRQWLLVNHYQYNWIGRGVSVKKGSADEHSTDPMPSRHCAVSSLNNKTPVVPWDAQTPARPVLERNGVTTSSPLNATA